jgi:hypothetical protein
MVLWVVWVVILLLLAGLLRGFHRGGGVEW